METLDCKKYLIFANIGLISTLCQCVNALLIFFLEQLFCENDFLGTFLRFSRLIEFRDSRYIPRENDRSNEWPATRSCGYPVLEYRCTAIRTCGCVRLRATHTCMYEMKQQAAAGNAGDSGHTRNQH